MECFKVIWVRSPQMFIKKIFPPPPPQRKEKVKENHYIYSQISITIRKLYLSDWIFKRKFDIYNYSSHLIVKSLETKKIHECDFYKIIEIVVSHLEYIVLEINSLIAKKYSPLNHLFA